jgi:hypothetical protein
MANIDISAKLGKEKQTITVAEGKVYEVDTSADTYLIIQDRIAKKEFSIDTMYEMLQTLLGEKALKEIKEMKPTIHELKVIITAVSALVSEVSYEEMEKRFQD